MTKCSECTYKVFEDYKGSPNRYYCTHPAITEGSGPKMICRCDRNSSELKTKSSPKWCPLKQKCRVCGCTWDKACPGGCYWVEKDLCSSCKAMGCN